MHILHLNAGNETGGGMIHILSLLNEFKRNEFTLGLLEEGLMQKKAKELGIRTVLFKQRGKFDVSVVRSVCRYMKEHHVDIVHTHGPRANVLGMIIKKKTGRRWVLTVHSDPRDDFLGGGLKGRCFTAVHLFAIKKADHCFAVSERFKKILTELGMEEEKITAILNGIDFRRTPEPYDRKAFRFRDNDFLILMVARLERVKGHEMALRALKKVARAHPNVRLLLIGDGSLRKELEDRAKKEGIGERVHFFGYRPDAERFYPMADVALLTSYSESFPFVLLEAARAGVPVITTDVGGVRHLVPDRRYGWVIDVGDENQLGESLMEAVRLKGEQKLREMGERLKDRASRRFSVGHFAESVYEVYRKWV